MAFKFWISHHGKYSSFTQFLNPAFILKREREREETCPEQFLDEQRFRTLLLQVACNPIPCNLKNLEIFEILVLFYISPVDRLALQIAFHCAFKWIALSCSGSV